MLFVFPLRLVAHCRLPPPPPPRGHAPFSACGHPPLQPIRLTQRVRLALASRGTSTVSCPACPTGLRAVPAPHPRRTPHQRPEAQAAPIPAARCCGRRHRKEAASVSILAVSRSLEFGCRGGVRTRPCGAVTIVASIVSWAPCHTGKPLATGGDKGNAVNTRHTGRIRSCLREQQRTRRRIEARKARREGALITSGSGSVLVPTQGSFCGLSLLSDRCSMSRPRPEWSGEACPSDPGCS